MSRPLPPHAPVAQRSLRPGGGAAPGLEAALQGSLFDQVDHIALRPLGAAVQRVPLSQEAWVDLRPGWVTGADALFAHLLSEVPWHGERRVMYDREVQTPRLLAFYREGAALPHPVLAEARDALSQHYTTGPDPEGEPFTTAGLCLYRSGQDSVAWHGDTMGRGSTHDTMVAIISVGAPRRLLLRPRGGGASRAFHVGHGDLLVMGGSCQRTWEHAVPKDPRVAGARVSVQLRPRGVR